MSTLKLTDSTGHGGQPVVLSHDRLREMTDETLRNMAAEKHRPDVEEWLAGVERLKQHLFRDELHREVAIIHPTQYPELQRIELPPIVVDRATLLGEVQAAPTKPNRAQRRAADRRRR